MKMKKLTILLLLIITLGFQVKGQERFLTREGHITFFSETPIENIEANNYNVLSILDLSRGQVAVDMLIKNFEFPKKLMQEHFNENYMESSKIPKATFKGSFDVPDGLASIADGVYPVDVQGEISIHGVSRTMNQTIDLEVKDGKILTEFKFVVKVADHDIKIPNVVVDKIAEEIEVTANFNYEPYER